MILRARRLAAVLFAATIPALAQTGTSTATGAATPTPTPTAGATSTATPTAGATSTATPTAWTERWDELWKTRDAAASLKELNAILKPELSNDPTSFEVNWRLASLLDWEGDGQGDGDFKAALGKGAWAAGDKAITARPEDVRGHYYGGVGIGLYSEAVGILTALSQGLEGKFRDRLLAAQRIDKDLLNGAPQVVWGRYFYKLPWPKRNLDESVKVLLEAVKSHRTNLRAKLFLADSLADSGRTDEAKKLATEIVEAKEGRDPPEERRIQARARAWLDRHR